MQQAAAVRRPYLHYDVFTGEPLTGNQLAVFPDGRDLAPERMQAIAREMAFSETTFVLPPEQPGTDARMRIFTPGAELPMAGHPTIGSAFALAHAGVIARDTARWVFGLGVGPTPVDLEWRDGRLRFAWMTQLNPAFEVPLDARAPVAAAIGLDEYDLAPALPVQAVSCGVPFLLVPLRDAATVDRAATDGSAFTRLKVTTGVHLPIYLFAVLPPGSGATVYSRMFAPELGIVEDPATGSASGPLGCYLVRHRLLGGDAARAIVNLQGVHMGRPSRIHVSIDERGGDIAEVRVGGEAVLVATGEMQLPGA
jgi:trans-2,3-dihydro-3-hydroxyanthranilate isomerase